MTDDRDMGASADAEQALVNGADKSSPPIGFDPSRLEKQIEEARARLIKAKRAAKALRWLPDYGPKKALSSDVGSVEFCATFAVSCEGRVEAEEYIDAELMKLLPLATTNAIQTAEADVRAAIAMEAREGGNEVPSRSDDSAGR